jgi:SAM-dependent methyltransferase
MKLADQVAAATAYEQFFVPALFRQWGPRVVSAARIRHGDEVLDVACGTGVLARAAAEVAGPGSVTGIDLNPAMLAVAGQTAPSISWREGSAESLPFPDASFDAVLSQFGLMFFGDRPAALREMWRVLRPGGRLAVAVWAALEDTPAYAMEVAILERIAGKPAADALRAPFALGDRRTLAALFDEARIPHAAIITVAETAHFPSLRAIVEVDLRRGLPLIGIPLEESVIEQVLAATESEMGEFVAADGTARLATPGHIVSATRD